MDSDSLNAFEPWFRWSMSDTHFLNCMETLHHRDPNSGRSVTRHPYIPYDIAICCESHKIVTQVLKNLSQAKE